MQPRERLSNVGYVAFLKEPSRGVPIRPTIFIPTYDESLTTNGNLVELDPIYGYKYETFTTIRGMRSHTGDITTTADPDTTAQLMDFLLTKLSTVGTTHTFGVSNTADPNTATMEVSYGNVVARFWGCGFSALAEDYNDNEKRHKWTVSALGSFTSRTLATVSTSTITLTTEYTATPNKGLVAGDLVRLYKPSTGLTTDFTVTTVNADGVTVVLNASAATFASGDVIHLRPQTASYGALSQTFMEWAKTYWKFGSTAALAAAAPQFRVEQGSTYTINHSFESNDGAPRSGDYDPAALVRTRAKLDVNMKRFFDTPEDIIAFNALNKSAIVIQHVAGATNQYNMTLNVNHVKTDSPLPNFSTGDIMYSELSYHPQYDLIDGQAFTVAVTCSLSSI